MRKLLSIAIIISLLLAPISGAETAVSETSHVNDGSSEQLTEAVQQSTILLQLKQKLAQAQYRYYLLQNNVDKAKDGIVEVREMISNLEEVLYGINSDIKDTNKQILSVKSQSERKRMELAVLEEKVQTLALEVEDQKDIVGDLMTLLYVKRGVFYDDSGINPVKVLASPGSVSETLQKITYLDLIEAENQDQIVKMSELNDELTQAWSELRIKREELEKLDEKLAGDMEVLKWERDDQQELLDEMLGEEAILEAMLESAGEREEDLLREIEIYKKNVELMEAKLGNTRVLLSDEERELIDRIESDMTSNFGIDEAANFLEMDWPVSPDQGLTAFFVDSSYVSVFGVQHYAIDIRAKHGSNIYAPADGVVNDIVYDPESTRYAYIMLAHRKGVMTLYGHVSEVAVQVGDYVQRGQIIGLSGGTPSSIGAGVRTTGPHLHFEVWQDGVRVDPLNYLPLEEVPLEYLPEDKLQEIQGRLEDQILEIQGVLDL